MPGGRIIYLVGFMGSGKTTAGKKLASALGWNFTDLDNMIEASAGMTVTEIFSKYGEEYFRELESDILRSASALTDTVVSTGGGTPCYRGNMEFMTGTGITVYLKLTPKQLMQRLEKSAGTRPLLKGLRDKELLVFIETKLAEREKWYSAAGIIVNGFSPDIKNLSSLALHELNV